MKQRWFVLLVSLALVVGIVGFAPLGVSARPHLAAFTPGNVVVYRVGTGAAALAATGTAVFLDEYTPAGGPTPVQSIAMPTTTVGSQLALLASGTAGSEGLLTLSEDRSYLVVPGYNGTLGAAVLVAASTVNRVIGRVDASGVADTSTGLSNAAFTGNVRSAASNNGTQFWVTSSNVGMFYVPFGSVMTATAVFAGTTNLRQVKIGRGQLYLGTASGSAFRLGTVGSGLPTTAGQTVASLPGLPTSGNQPYGYALFDLDVGVAGYDTLYMTENTAAGGIYKYSLVAGSWITNGLISLASPVGLTGINNGSTVALYATTTSALYQVTDTAGYNAAPSTTTPTSIATASTNTAFRGVTFAPGTTSPNAITLTTFSGSTPADNGWIIVILLAASALLIGGWALRHRMQA